MSRYYDEEYIFGSEDEAGWFDEQEDQDRICQEIEKQLEQEDEPEKKRLVNEAYNAEDWSVSTPKLRTILDEQERSRKVVAKQLAFVLSETPEPEPEEEEEEVFKYHDSLLIINAEATNAAFLSNWPEMIQDNLKYYEDRNKKEIQLFVENNPDVGRFTVECLRKSTF
jgi:hypothetical protein